MSKKSLKDSLQLNKPRRTPDHKTKSHVVKVNDGGTERLIRFGQQGVTTAGKPKKGESQTQKNRRKSFKARHAQNIKKGPTSAAYWANKVKWNEGGRVLGVTGDDPLTEAMTGTLGQFRTTQDRDPRTVTQETNLLADLNEDGRIDFYDGYEAVRPSYPSEIGGALKQAGSNISQGDIAKGAAMLGLSGLMAADYIPGAKLATSTIGRPIKSFLQDVAGNLPDTSVLEAASYKGRLRDALRGSKQKTMTIPQVKKQLEGVSQTEKRFLDPELENIRYQAKLQEMAGEKPDDTVTTEYLEKVLDRTEPGRSYVTRSGTTERYPTVLQEKEFPAYEAPYYNTMRRPEGVFGDDAPYSDEYKEIVVTLTPEMKRQYQRELQKAGMDAVDVENVHYVDHPNAVFHMRVDQIRDKLPDGNYKYVTFSEEFQNDTAIKVAKEGEYDQFTPLTLSSSNPTSRIEGLKLDITEQMLKEDPFNTSKSSLKLSGLPTGTENIERGFKELPEKISRKDKAELQEKIALEIEETKEKLENALYLDPPTVQVPLQSSQGTVYETARRTQDDPYAIEEIKYELQRLDAQRRLLNNVNTPEGVPKNFPFLKEWPKLAMQRLVNEGVGNSSDAIGWISGNQSAAVRNATRHIEAFEYDPSNGLFTYIDPVRGREVVDDLGGDFNTEQIPEIIGMRYGEEIKKIIQAAPSTEVTQVAFNKPIVRDVILPETSASKEKNLAEGARTLYDTVMVKEAKKLGKKYGVEPYQLPEGDWRMDITPEMREDFMLDVTYAEGGAVELDLGMDERDYQRAVTKETSSIADLNDDGVVNYVDLVEALRPTAPQELQEMGQTIIKLLSDDEIAKATTMAGMMGISLIPFGRAATAGPRRDMTRSVMKEYDPNIVESRAEDIVKGVEGRGGRGPELKAGQDEIDYSKRRKEELDPVGYQKTKFDKPIEEVDIEEEQIVELAPRKKINIEDLEGKMVLPFYGDRTSTGKRITRVDDIEFEQPVDTEGGRDFMRSPAAQSEDKAIWASEQGIIRRLDKRAKDVAEKTGKDVLAITGTMSPNAVDFSTMSPETLAEMVAVTITRGGLKKKDIKEFDRLMKDVQVTKDDDMAPVKDWPGLDAPNLREYLVETKGDTRKKFLRLMEKATFQRQGFPSSGKARIAVTDKEQLMLGPGMFGGSIGKIDVDADIITDPLMPHKTYNTQLRGEYVGEIDPVHQSELFRDFYEGRKDKKIAGKPEAESQKTYALTRQLPAQEITPEIVDRNMTAAERKKRGYQEGGAVEVSILDKVFDTILGAQPTGALEVQEGKIRFAEGGVYNAKKIDMMSDQILESYDV